MVNPGRAVFTSPSRRQRFEALVAGVFEDLYRFAVRLEGDPVEAEDLLQAALTTGFSRLDQLREDGAYKTWQSRIVLRTHINRRRKRKESVMPPEAADNVVVLDPRGPDRAAERRELADSLTAALQRLPEDQRLAVLLVDLQGCELREAADILEVPWGTVASRLARGRKALRSRLASVAREQGVIR